MSNVIKFPSIAGVEIITDAEGRFNLNALHRASQTGDHKRPSKWLETKQAQELILAYNAQSPNSGFGTKSTTYDSVVVQHGGNSQGTFADEVLAVSYAGWISPSFQIEVNKTFLEYRTKAKRKPYVDPLILEQRQAVAVMQSVLQASRLLGTDKAMARVIAVGEANKISRIDFAQLLIDNTVPEAPVTPTELGKEIGLSAMAMNKALEADEFQQRNEDGDWMPTKKGKPYCTVNPYKSPNSDHTGYRVLWYRPVLDVLNVDAAVTA